jgi:hypothetical protein
MHHGGWVSLLIDSWADGWICGHKFTKNKVSTL